MRRTQQSFTGGEISPEMQGRISLPDYQAGMARMQNFLALPQGPAQARPGFEFRSRTKPNKRFGQTGESQTGPGVSSYSKARLIPFKFSDTDSMVLEIGSQIWAKGTISGVTMGSPVEANSFGVNFVSDSEKSWTTSTQPYSGVEVGPTDQYMGGSMDGGYLYIPELYGFGMKARFLITSTGTDTSTTTTSVNCYSQDERLPKLENTLSLAKPGMDYQIERGYIRFHRDGGLVSWGASRTVESIDYASNTLVFTADHGFNNGDEVRFFETVRWDPSETVDQIITVKDPSTGPTAGGSVQQTAYEVSVVDARRIQLKYSSSVVPLTEPSDPTLDGTEVFRVFLNSEVPQTYLLGTQNRVTWSPSNPSSENVIAFDDGASQQLRHNLIPNQRIQFYKSTATDVLPTGITQGAYYYAYIVNDTTIKLLDAPDGNVVTLTANGAGQADCHMLFEEGDLVFRDDVKGGFFYNASTIMGRFRPPELFRGWHRMPGDGVLEINFAIGEADLMDFTYAQRNDVLTICHNRTFPLELRRLSDTRWHVRTPVYDSPLGKPATPPDVTSDRGQSIACTLLGYPNQGPYTITSIEARTPVSHHLLNADFVYIDSVDNQGGTVNYEQFNDRYWEVDAKTATTFRLKDPKTGERAAPDPPFTWSTEPRTPRPGKLYYSDTLGVDPGTIADNSDALQVYRYTAIDDSDLETEGSDESTASNLLTSVGAFNRILVTAVPGAKRYRIYKKEAGIFGFIGEVEDDGSSSSFEFLDRNIAPDLGISLPLREDETGPVSAVGYYDQRRLFGGGVVEPLTTWMTRPGTESDLTFSIPSRPDNRIRFDVSSQQRDRIRHFAGMDQLLILTDQNELRVTPVNSDAITPSSISVRPQSYIGSSPVTPVVVNNLVVFAENRGGHLRVMGYRRDSGGYATTDLSMRASHLFDLLSVKDLAYQRSPYPFIWAVSSSGKLLGLTYVPEENLSGWHQHTTQDGSFESVACIKSAEEDDIFVVVKRTVGGETYRSVERMATQRLTSLPSAFFVDSGLSADFANTDVNKLLKVTTQTGQYTPGSQVSLLFEPSSSHVFRTSGEDVGEIVTISDGTTTGDIRLTEITNSRLAVGVVVSEIPAAVRDVATSVWGRKRKSLRGLDHLSGATVNLLADGVPSVATVSATGTVTLPNAASVVAVGLPIDAVMQTLPMVANVEGGGQGRTRNPSSVWLKVADSAGGFAGGVLSSVVPTGLSRTELETRVVDVSTPGEWEEGQLFIKQTLPLPLTVTSMTIDYGVA